MIRLFISAIILIVSVVTFAQDQAPVKNHCVFEPQYIIEGSTGNTLTYDPEGTALANSTDIRCVMYFFNGENYEATDVDLTQKEGKWVGTFTAPANASLLVCKFVSGNAIKEPQSLKTDWGWPMTYTSFILDKNQKNKQGANMAWGLLRTPYSPLTVPGILEDSTAVPIQGDVTLFWFNNEFRYFPESQPRYFGNLVKILNQVKPGEKNEQLKENIHSFLNDKKLKLTDQQWSDMYDICLRTLNDSALAKEVKEKEQKLYRNGIIQRDEEIKKIADIYVKDYKEGDKFFEKFIKTYPTEKFQDVHTFTTDLFYGKLFRSPIYTLIMKEDKYDNLYKYLHDIPYVELISTHWHIAEIPFTNGQVTAEKVYPHSKAIIDEILNRQRVTAEQKTLSPREFEEGKITTFSMAIYAHARICTALGKYDEAMKYAEMVYPIYQAGNTEYATTWIKLLQENGRNDEVMPYIEKCVFNNQTSQEMLDLLKAEYLKKNPNGDYEKYYSTLQNKGELDAERQKVLASMVDEPINLNYVLDKLGGGTVDLSKKQGKIMFLDFWATWCAPCKASMPGGQMAVDRYKDDPDVEFYFIDTCETDKNYRNKVSEFIKSKGYTFNVLYDQGAANSQDKMFKEYCAQLHTSGIPFKVIIDGKGHLRWSMCGYYGSPTGMADEIQYVIDYLKSENN